MTARSRRKTALRRKRKAVRFTLVVEGQKMIVGYKPNWMAGCGQFEFRSPHRPPRRIPGSETGYLCHFALMDDVKAARNPKVYARDFVLAALAPRRSLRPDDAKQLWLFA